MVLLEIPCSVLVPQDKVEKRLNVAIKKSAARILLRTANKCGEAGWLNYKNLMKSFGEQTSCRPVASQLRPDPSVASSLFSSPYRDNSNP
ncbi:DEKNAAC102543 [Brettanomyces naardenensis]|uniref:DEKNAAC102543 n=1 Tax=Brettanomyces naardenensis TaxID=13370 RepID=A0A448YLD6_BRENA|nr:DEKNAAC102543 [Brettanomyces naardenensis]